MPQTQKTYQFRKKCLQQMQKPLSETAVRQALVGSSVLSKRQAERVIQKVWSWSGLDHEMPKPRIDYSLNGYAAFFPSNSDYPNNSIVFQSGTVPIRSLLHEACHAILFHLEKRWGHTSQFRTLELAAYDDLLPGCDICWEDARRIADSMSLEWTPLPKINRLFQS